MNELEVPPKNAWELMDTETEYVETPVLPVKWSVEKYNAAQMMALSGLTKKQIAKKMGLTLGVLNKWCESAEFNEYIQSLVQEYAKNLKNDRIMFLTKIVNARRENAEEEGYADASRKDTVDILAELRKETEATAGGSGNNFTNLLESLMKHSLAHQPKTIPVENNQ